MPSIVVKTNHVVMKKYSAIGRIFKFQIITVGWEKAIKWERIKKSQG
jgi:hypothetical protein